MTGFADGLSSGINAGIAIGDAWHRWRLQDADWDAAKADQSARQDQSDQPDTADNAAAIQSSPGGQPSAQDEASTKWRPTQSTQPPQTALGPSGDTNGDGVVDYHDQPADLSTVPHPAVQQRAALDQKDDDKRERGDQSASGKRADAAALDDAPADPNKTVTDADGDLGRQQAASPTGSPVGQAAPVVEAIQQRQQALAATPGARRDSNPTPNEVGGSDSNTRSWLGEDNSNPRVLAPAQTPPAPSSPAQGAAGMANPAAPQGGASLVPVQAPAQAPAQPQALAPAQSQAQPQTPPPTTAVSQPAQPQAAMNTVNPGAHAITPSPTPNDVGGPAASPTPAPAQAQAQPKSLGAKILGALNPVSSAQAAPAAAPASTAPAQTQGQTQAQAPTPAAAQSQQQALQDDKTAPAGVKAAPNATTTVAPRNAPTAPIEKGMPPAARIELPQSRDAIVPGQTTPTTQSERTPEVRSSGINPQAFTWLAKNRPEDAKLVQQIAARNGITPERLAAHWWKESGLRRNAPDGAAGERGVMQVLPSTQAMSVVDPHGDLNPADYKQSLEMGARYIRYLDGQFGQDKLSSVIAYNGGPGTANAVARGEHTRGAEMATEYASHPVFFGGQSFKASDLSTAAGIDPAKMDQAAQQAGPNGLLHYIANTEPRNMPLSDKWRAAEDARAFAIIARGGSTAELQASRDYISQMAQRGANQALMAAHRSMVLGDNYSAAQQLAKAHAFFPDGTIGRFGVDDKNQLWATRVDEHDPSKALGPPSRVTLDQVQGMLIQSQDPNRYVALVQQQQKQASELRFQAQHGKYFEEMSKYRQYGAEDRAQDRADRLEETKFKDDELIRHNRAMEGIAAERTAGRGASTGPDPAKVTGIDKEVAGLYGPGAQTAAIDGQPLNTDQAAIASQVHTDLRLGSNNHAVSQPEAYRLATGVATGKMRLVANQNGDYGVYRSDAQPGDKPEAVISKEVGDRLTSGLLRQSRQAARTAGLPTTTPSSSAMPSRAIH